MGASGFVCHVSVCGRGWGEKTYRAVQIGQMRQTAKLVLVCQGHFSEQKAITRSCDMTRLSWELLHAMLWERSGCAVLSAVFVNVYLYGAVVHAWLYIYIHIYIYITRQIDG